MSNILNLPKEILDKIFHDLTITQLLRCQRLCKKWYHVFHLRLLNSIHLYGADNIIEFIASIDSNLDPTYLNAVTSMTFYTGDVEDYFEYDEGLQERFADERIFQRLFFRFPNLKDVFFHGDIWILERLNDGICKTFLKRCPKLDKFEAYYHYEDIYFEFNPAEYYSSIRGARLLITSFDIRPLGAIISSFPAAVDYVAGFPRLRKIRNTQETFDNFYEWRPILEKLPNCNSMNIGLDDPDFFVKDIMQDTSSPIPREYAKRLSHIHELWCEMDTLPVNAMMFSCKYLTKLDDFIMNIHFCNDWNKLQKHLFCVGVLHLLSTVRKFGLVSLQRLELPFLSATFAAIMRRVFDDLSTNVQRTNKTNYFKVVIEGERGTQNTVDLLLKYYNKDGHNRFVCVTARNGLGLHSILSSLFTRQLDNVDTFDLQLKNKYDTHANEVDINVYDRILSRLPLLKRVILDIPVAFKDSTQVQGYSGTVRHQVEELTLKATPNVGFQALLNRFHYTFPSLKVLHITYFSGTFNAQSGVFDLLLSEYSLEALTLDLTPVKNKTLTLKVPLDNYFFVIDVQLPNDRQLFQVAANLSWATRIKEEELDGFTCNRHFYRVHVAVSSLVRLQLYNSCSECSNDDQPSYVSRGGEKKLRLIRLDYSEDYSLLKKKR